MKKTANKAAPAKLVPLTKTAQKQLVGGASRKTSKETCDAVGGKYDSKTSMCTY